MSIPVLADLPLYPYVDESGQIPPDREGQIGVYAIFDAAQQLQYVGYSRNVYLSLKQHLVRQPDACYGFKMVSIEKPNRQILTDIQTTWLNSVVELPPGNGERAAAWTEAIDATAQMTAEERAQFDQADGLTQDKLLKTVARRVEAEIKERLRDRGVTMTLIFNPKLKAKGLLDLK